MLTVYVASFSLLKNPPPHDPSHGGGFVFDCRFLPNPGRTLTMRTLTGKDALVIEYLESIDAVVNLQSAVLKMVEPAIEQYLERSFDTMLVSFGCTGGQHRSVFLSEWFNDYLKSKYQDQSVLTTTLTHVNASNWVRE